MKFGIINFENGVENKRVQLKKKKKKSRTRLEEEGRKEKGGRRTK
jgi:hypothetical protein